METIFLTDSDTIGNSPSMETVSDLVRKNGGAQAVADLFGVTRPAVVKWCRKNQFPARLTVDIAHAFGVPETVLRPDIFRKPAARLDSETRS